MQFPYILRWMPPILFGGARKAWISLRLYNTFTSLRVIYNNSLQHTYTQSIQRAVRSPESQTPRCNFNILNNTVLESKVRNIRVNVATVCGGTCTHTHTYARANADNFNHTETHYTCIVDCWHWRFYISAASLCALVHFSLSIPITNHCLCAWIEWKSLCMWTCVCVRMCVSVHMLSLPWPSTALETPPLLLLSSSQSAWTRELHCAVNVIIIILLMLIMWARQRLI